MSDPARLAIAFAVALGVTSVAMPWIIRLAHRTSFYDLPTGYKRHPAATPYLGGMAVVVGLVAGALATSAGTGETRAVLGIAACLLVVGTLDDRVGLGVGVRIGAEVAAGVALYYSGIDWAALDRGPANLLLTVVFVLGTINAFNLMDNLDGAASTVAMVAAALVGVYIAADGAELLAPLALALAGACAGFLPHNLARPSARVFLGDGGSMPIGLTVAALILSAQGASDLGWAMVPVTVVMVGLPAFDTTLVIVSRRRRGVQVLSGGRDHLTHRLLSPLGTPRRVAIALSGGQAAATSLAIWLLQLRPAAAVAVSVAALLAGSAVVAFLEFPLAARVAKRTTAGAPVPLDVPERGAP